MEVLTLGSLFDGIGGFPLSGKIVGIKPVWAAEIDPACVAVTKRHFPNIEHLGSVTDINGAEITPVDIITFGSPCQDLSIAGKKAGLFGEQSILFKEAIRIIYEMREATYGKYPTFIVWENVPGAFSSNKGRDFRTVLEEITQAKIPMPSSGKWARAGVVRGHGICAAWRQLDAQYWGVPQRRKRIFLVGSFGNNGAEEILFERDSVQWHLTAGRTARQKIASDIGESIDLSDKCFDVKIKENNNLETVCTVCDHDRHMNNHCMVTRSLGFHSQNSTTSASVSMEYEKTPTLECSKRVNVLFTINQNEWIVRRATPLECERLQGFPDHWTALPKIKDMNDDEYHFFLKVFLYDKKIRGKSCKNPPTKTSLVKWYNKLDCDENRYKQCGNSLAIPCAVRVLGGISDYANRYITVKKG